MPVFRCGYPSCSDWAKFAVIHHGGEEENEMRCNEHMVAMFQFWAACVRAGISITTENGSVQVMPIDVYAGENGDGDDE